MSDTSLVFNLIARDRASGTMQQMQERFTASSAAIGAGVGMALGVGIANALNVEAANAKLAAQLGMGPAEAAEVAKVSASVYENAWGDSVETVNLAIKGVYQNIGDVSQAEGGLEAVTTKALALAETFDQDLSMTTAAVGQLMRTGLADSAEEAFDIITVGLQSSADKSGDFLETLNEYSTQWRRVGLDGQTATGLLSQALKAGARDADQVADAIGQFGERALAGGAPVEAAFESIGLSAADMARMLGAGGDQAERALQMTMDGLRGASSEQVKLNAAAALFGDPGNVMGASLFALDPATAAAAAGMDKATGATDRLVESVGSNPAKSLEKFKREALGKLTEVSGGFIEFATENQTVFIPLAYTLAGLAGTVLIVRGAMMAYSAVSAVVAGANAVISASAWGVIGNWLRMMSMGLMAYARIAGAAVVSAATTSAAWVGSALASIGTWIAAVVRAGITAAAQFALMAARAVVWAATMAAQWLIAMGPIGWVILAVAGLVTLVVMYWDQIRAGAAAAWDWVWQKIQSVAGFIVTLFMNFTLPGLLMKHWATIQAGASAAWGAIIGWLKGVPGMIYNAFLNFTPIGLMIKHWDTIRNVVISKARGVVGWLRGLPGMMSGAIGNLGSLLYNHGRNVVLGLWNGIRNMGGWLRSTLISWASHIIPGPIMKALGIASPSKLMADLVGEQIPAGVVVGMEARQDDVTAAMARLVQPPATSMTAGAGQFLGAGVSGAAPVTRPGFGMAPVARVVFDFTGADSAFKTAIQKIVRVDGRGVTQTAFGR